MSETTEQQGRAPGLYDEQLQRQLQEKRVLRDGEHEQPARNLPLFAGALETMPEPEKRSKHRAVAHSPAGG